MFLSQTDPPVITEHPVGGDVPIGMNITLKCRGSGLGSLRYAWQRHHRGNWTTIDTDATVLYTATTSGSYRCILSNEGGPTLSNRTRVNIYGEYSTNHEISNHTSRCTGPPTITTQPATQLLTIGMDITLNCEGTGRGVLTYYWEEREQGNTWRNIGGENNSALTIRNIQKPVQFRCIVSNEAGSTKSHPAIITLLGKR